VRIVHCIHGLSLAGAQQVIRHVIEGSDRERFRYFVYAHLDGPLRPEIERAGATVRLIHRRLPLFDPAWAWALRRAMVDDRIDVVHTHLFGDSLHGFLAARAAGRLPVVTTLHSHHGGEPPLRRWGYARLLPRMDRVVACSKSSYRSYDAAFGGRLDLRKIVNGIPPAPEIESTAGSDLVEPDMKTIVTVGRQSPEKGLDDLLRAFALLDPAKVGEVRLVLVGDGPLRGELEALARELSIASRVRFAGLRTDVRQILPRFELAAFSSHFEGLPIAVLEAMAAGRAIVATDAEGIADCVAHGREALLAPRRDPAALARALEEVLGDADLRRRLGEAARERFEREFRAERMLRAYEDLYLEVVASRGTA